MQIFCNCIPYLYYHLQFPLTISLYNLLRCFDAVGWVAGRASGLQKTEWWGAGVVVCLEQGADLHMVQLMPMPLTVSCFSKIQIGFSFLVPAHLGSPGKRAVKRVCVCVWVSIDSDPIRIFTEICDVDKTRMTLIPGTEKSVIYFTVLI